MATVRFVNSISSVNTNNYHEDAPFRFDSEQLVFDTKLWTLIKTKWIGMEIVKIFGIPLLENNVKYNKSPDDDKLYWKVYHLFNDWTAGNNWFNIIPNSITIEIPDKELDILIETSNKIILHNEPKLDDILPETLSELKNKMLDIGYFIKTQDTSTKKDYRPKSVHTPHEALMHILASNECNRSFKRNNKKKYLLLSPWQENLMSSHNEFRVFIIDDKIAGISQQNIYNISIHMIEIWSYMAEDIYVAVEKLYADIKYLLPYEFQYDQCCLDIWIEQINENIIAHLIEINGRGGWSSAGSSLYCWKYDPPIAQKRELLIRC